MAYVLHQIGQAKAQIEDLVRKTANSRIKGFVLDNLRRMAESLERDPSSFGDPVYDTTQRGGTVYRAILNPLIFHFVVFEPRKEVFLFKVMPMPNTELAE